MNITVEITVTVDRADGSHTRITQVDTRHAGDNPRMERDEVAASIAPVVGSVIVCFPENTAAARAVTPAERCPATNRGYRCEGDNGHTGNHYNLSVGENW